jgi:hypothetical protein
VGFSVAGVGDVNGDGLADLLIGAAHGGSGTGESFLVYGDVQLSGVSSPDVDTLHHT